MAKNIQYEFIKDYKEGIHNIKKGEIKILSNALKDNLLENKIIKVFEKKKLAKKK